MEPKRYEATVYLRGGMQLSFECKTIKAVSSCLTGGLQSLEWTGATGARPLYIRIDDVIAVICKAIDGECISVSSFAQKDDVT